MPRKALQSLSVLYMLLGSWWSGPLVPWQQSRGLAFLVIPNFESASHEERQLQMAMGKPLLVRPLSLPEVSVWSLNQAQEGVLIAGAGFRVGFGGLMFSNTSPKIILPRVLGNAPSPPRPWLWRGDKGRHYVLSVPQSFTCWKPGFQEGAMRDGRAFRR